MRFTQLTLENWRNFTRVNVSFVQRVFIVGPNASGKSNLLDVFRFLRDLATPDGGGFRSAVGRRLGISKIRCLSARAQPNVVVDVTLGDANGPRTNLWRYKIVFGQDSKHQPSIKEEKVWKNGQDAPLIARPDPLDRADPERLRQTHLEQITANKDFRDIADFFASVRYLHLVPQLVREPERSAGRQQDPFGGDFLEQIARKSQRTRQSRLNLIRQALTVAVPQLQKLELWQDPKGIPHLRGLYKNWRPDAGWQTEEQFSDGTLRLLGLLWAVLEGDGPLLLEEPELSLHSEVVRQIPRVFARIQRKHPRQILISTHSREILSDEGIGGEEVIMLTPSQEGTQAALASSERQVRSLLEGGATAADAVIPRTGPRDARQLALFKG